MTPEISESDTVFMKKRYGLHNLGDGFHSAEEVEEYIRNNFEKDPGDYEYGVFSSVGTVTIEKPPSKTETLSEETLTVRSEIIEQIESNSIVEDVFTVDSQTQTVMGSIYQSTIRYQDGEVDFRISLNADEFPDAPLSTIDQEVADEMEQLFNSLVNNSAIYLGYNSGYRKRGRRDPYVELLGRVPRDTPKDNTVQSLYEVPFINGLYWSSENISPLRLYHEEGLDVYNEDKEEIIAVFDITDETEDLDDITREVLEDVVSLVKKLEDRYDIEPVWFGKVAFHKNFHQIAVGIRYSEKQ